MADNDIRKDIFSSNRSIPAAMSYHFELKVGSFLYAYLQASKCNSRLNTADLCESPSSVQGTFDLMLT